MTSRLRAFFVNAAYRRVAPALLTLCLLALNTPLQAQGVYEGFNEYASSADILATNGGDGFLNNWQPRNTLLNGGGGVPSANSVQLLPSSLAYTDSAGNQLQTAGGSMLVTGEFGSTHVARTYDVSAFPHSISPPPTGAVTYISFLGRRSGPAADPNDPVYGGSYPWGSNLYPRTAGVNFLSDDNGDAVPMHIGNLSNVTEDVWTLNGQDLDDDPPQTNSPFGAGSNTYLLVFKIEHATGDGGGDQVHLYMSPLLASEGLNTPDLIENWEKDDDPLHLPGRWISVEAGNTSSNRPYSEFTFDELRIGATWADVTPIAPVVPEPSTMALGMLTLAMASGRRSRR
jgi:hypothetical protein